MALECICQSSAWLPDGPTWVHAGCNPAVVVSLSGVIIGYVRSEERLDWASDLAERIVTCSYII